MKELDLQRVTDEVERMCIEGNYFIGKEVLDKIKEAYAKEESEVGKNILGQIIENDEIAANEQVPMCQDTGIVVVFLEVGTEVRIPGDIYAAINEGVRRGYEKGYLRKSVVKDPLFERTNTKDNTPAIIYYDIVEGDTFHITLAPKGFGSENMSQIKMLKPSDGLQGIKDFVMKVVNDAGPNACPPMVIGVGIGGSFDKVAMLAKKAMIREIGSHHPDQRYASLEDELLQMINETGIGPAGYGGKTTALSLNIETFPTHIAGMPVAVSICCHVSRHKEVSL